MTFSYLHTVAIVHRLSRILLHCCTTVSAESLFLLNVVQSPVLGHGGMLLSAPRACAQSKTRPCAPGGLRPRR